MISYEVAMGLSLVAVFLYAGSMSTSEIVAAQDDLWFALILLPSFVIYVISMVGETNRAPFDLPEAEGELVGGFHTEYSVLKFALFFLAEYINMVTVSAHRHHAVPRRLAGAVGHRARLGGRQPGYWPVCGSSARSSSSCSSSSGCAASLPRMRYDQFMALGWKILIPVSLAWILAVGDHPRHPLEGDIDRTYLIAAIASLAGADRGAAVRRRRQGPTSRGRRRGRGRHDAFAGGYPVPPMPAGGAVRGAAAR